MFQNSLNGKMQNVKQMTFETYFQRFLRHTIDTGPGDNRNI